MKKADWIRFAAGVCRRASLFLSLGLMLGTASAAISGRNTGSPKNNTEKTALLLDGLSLDYRFFAMTSRGKLTMIAGDPYSPTATKIPFRLYLKRNGQIVHQSLSRLGREITEIEIGEVLAFARHGDDLVIEPVRKGDSGIMQVIRLRSFWFLPLPQTQSC